MKNVNPLKIVIAVILVVLLIFSIGNVKWAFTDFAKGIKDGKEAREKMK